MKARRKMRGMFYTISVILLIIPLILLVAYYATSEKTKKEDTVSKLRCDELHYFVEDVREDLSRANVIFGRRAAIYSVDKVVTTGVPLRDYNFNCSSNCKVNCSQFSFDVNGSEAAIAELTLCGTLYGSNVTYMVNHTLSQWLDRIGSHGGNMNFNVSIGINRISVVPYDAWSFAVIINSSFNVFDMSKTCYYQGDSVQVVSYTSIIGLEDPLYPLNTNSYVVKYIENCSAPIIFNTRIAGCSKEDAGNGTSTGKVIYYSEISNQDAATYCSDHLQDIQDTILVMDTAFGSAPCQKFEQCCFNISCANHFAGAINYDVNREIPFVRNCDMTIPWIAGTGDMDDIGNQIPGWDRTEGCNQMNLTHASCVMIKNNECPLHQVRVGYDSNSTNTTCYYISNVTAYGGTNGPSFFDRLDGNYELGSKYLNQSIYYFNNSWIGIETLVDPYELNSFSVQVKMNATWVDYLYWQNVQGCKVSGMCGAGSYNFRLDNVHARMFNLDTDCVNVTECPTGDEACVNCFDEDNDTLWDWEDDNCDAFFNDCGQVHSCDPMDTDHCSTCDVPMPPEANSSQTCSYYGFNATEWHFYRITPAQSGKLRVSFSGTSGAPSDQKTDIIFYNYSIDGNTCSNRTVKYNIEPSSTFDYCVTAGQIYVLGLDVDSTACGYNGTYELQTQVTAGDPLCTTTTTSTTTTTNPAPTTTSSSTTSSTSTTSTSTTTTQPSCGFFDNMEFGVGSWTHGGAQDEWQLGSPSWGSAYSGSNVWATDLVGDYQDNASEWLKTRSISLVTATNPRLRFWEKRQVENNYDYCYVEVSTDNLNWDTIQTYTGNRNSWTERSLSLNSYTGVNVWIRFRLESDGDITRYGWYLDNVNVTCS